MRKTKWIYRVYRRERTRAISRDSTKNHRVVAAAAAATKKKKKISIHIGASRASCATAILFAYR